MARDKFSQEIELKEGQRSTAEIDSYPDHCPWCDNRMSPDFRFAQSLGKLWDYDEVLEVVFRCSVNECKRYFLAYYYKVDRHGDYFFLRKTAAPHYIKDISFVTEIEELSPNFCTIFLQAHSAEVYGLDQISGPGYGKALEYLIKDYLIKMEPERKIEIGSASLSKLINDIEDRNLQICAKRAWWLRNDETHYERRWEKKDVQDLKELIELSTLWIKSQIITFRYKEEMPDKST